MGDHLFEAPVLRRMLELQVADGDSILAVDSSPADPAVADEATRPVERRPHHGDWEGYRSVGRARHRPVRVFTEALRRP